jgi:tetratricopeptide (TPR) repeat protein
MKTKGTGNVWFGPWAQLGCLLLMVMSVGGAALFAIWATFIYQPRTSSTLVAVPTLAQGTLGHTSVDLASPAATPSPRPAPPTATATGTPTALPSPTPTLTATPTATATPTPLLALPAQVYLEDMPHEYQKLNNCGPVSLAASANFFGIHITQFDAAAVVKGSPEDRNVSPHEMVDYLHSLGLGAVYRVNGDAEVMRRLLANDLPVIVHQWLVRPQDGVLVGHYRVLRGYDSQAGDFVANDPYTGPRLSIPYAQFDEWWRPFNRGYIPVYRLEQEGLVASILGDDWDELANHQRALAQAQQETETFDDGYAFFNMGDEYLALGDAAAAVAAYDQAFAFQFPDHFLWYQFGPLEAFNAVGDHQRVLDITGHVLSQAGELEEARMQRGLAYLGVGDVAAARLEFEKALAANPHFESARAALDSLEPPS